jgi:A/G-specific adenine glycosylase
MPPDALAHRRRTQAWTGTDRQVRGLIMAALRAADHPLPAQVVTAVWPDDAQRDRALTGLLADGLVEQVPSAPAAMAPAYRLPE